MLLETESLEVAIGLVSTINSTNIANLLYVEMEDVYDFVDRNGIDVRSVTIVGLNPSNSSPDESPFHKSTMSRSRIDRWFSNEFTDDVYSVSFTNVIRGKRTSTISRSELKEQRENLRYRFTETMHKHGESIIALGEKASFALSYADVEHFRMPHPSGLNRFWNDREAGDAKIREMLTYINNNSKVWKG